MWKFLDDALYDFRYMYSTNLPSLFNDLSNDLKVMRKSHMRNIYVYCNFYQYLKLVRILNIELFSIMILLKVLITKLNFFNSRCIVHWLNYSLENVIFMLFLVIGELWSSFNSHWKISIKFFTNSVLLTSFKRCFQYEKLFANCSQAHISVF